MTESETNTNRYVNSKVYKLVDDQGYYYWGSTCMPLSKRFYGHKQASQIRESIKVYTIFTHARFMNSEIKIVLGKTFNLNLKEELAREENKYIEQSLDDDKCLNSIRAVQNYEANKQKDKEYYKANKKRYSNIVKQIRNILRLFLRLIMVSIKSILMRYPEYIMKPT